MSQIHKSMKAPIQALQCSDKVLPRTAKCTMLKASVCTTIKCS